jgi:hypothetical protein
VGGADVSRPDDLTVVLHRRTPGEVRAWREGARLALTMVQQKLPPTTQHPPSTGALWVADVAAAIRQVMEAIDVTAEVDAWAAGEVRP